MYRTKRLCLKLPYAFLIALEFINIAYDFTTRDKFDPVVKCSPQNYGRINDSNRGHAGHSDHYQRDNKGCRINPSYK